MIPTSLEETTDDIIVTHSCGAKWDGDLIVMDAEQTIATCELAKHALDRLHSKGVPGRPDLVFIARRKVVFVHGCFCHGHDACQSGRTPRTRTEFWRAKLNAKQGS